MKTLIAGVDGYLGWALALRLLSKGHQVIGIDNFYTRKAVKEVGSDSALPIGSFHQRIRGLPKDKMSKIALYKADVTDYGRLKKIISKYRPDSIVDFAEQRSAPYSMRSRETASHTLSNNIIGTLNFIYAIKEINREIHFLKMGTMGEYGTPNFDIPESTFIEASINGKTDMIITPKYAGSWYHWSKVYDTDNLIFANKIWGLTTTDIMQGPVYGTRTSEITDSRLFTRFDFDETWGTVLNRYCVEAVLGMPLTPYGSGGQTRAFLSLEDSVTALSLLLENPPASGNYRTVNQFTETYSVLELANIVQERASALGLKTEIKNVDNPRVEAEKHYYNPERKILPGLGLKGPTKNLKDEIEVIIKDLLPYKNRLEKHRSVIAPKTNWRA